MKIKIIAVSVTSSVSEGWEILYINVWNSVIFIEVIHDLKIIFQGKN